MAIAFESEGARFDLFAESGGARPAGIVLDSLFAPGVRSLAALEGTIVIDPPPGLVRPLGPAQWQARLAEVQAQAEAETAVACEADFDLERGGENAGGREQKEPEDEDEGADDDAELGDIERYRLRRAAEGLADREEALPTLDAAAELEADAQAVRERAVLTPVRTYWIDRVRVRFGAIERQHVDLEVHAEARAIGSEGEMEQVLTRVYARLWATFEVV